MTEQTEQVVEAEQDADLFVEWEPGPGDWRKLTDEVEERVPNVKLDQDKRLKKPVHFVCPLYQNHMFLLGSVERRDRWGKRIAGVNPRVCKFTNGHFFATTKHELDYCRGKGFIFEEPDEGFEFEYIGKRGVEFTTRSHAAFQAYQRKKAS